MYSLLHVLYVLVMTQCTVNGALSNSKCGTLIVNVLLQNDKRSIAGIASRCVCSQSTIASRCGTRLTPKQYYRSTRTSTSRRMRCVRRAAVTSTSHEPLVTFLMLICEKSMCVTNVHVHLQVNVHVCSCVLCPPASTCTSTCVRRSTGGLCLPRLAAVPVTCRRLRESLALLAGRRRQVALLVALDTRLFDGANQLSLLSQVSRCAAGRAAVKHPCVHTCTCTCTCICTTCSTYVCTCFKLLQYTQCTTCTVNKSVLVHVCVHV